MSKYNTQSTTNLIRPKQSMQPLEYRVSCNMGSFGCLLFHVLAPIPFSQQTIGQSYVLAQAANASRQMCKSDAYSPSSPKSIFPTTKIASKLLPPPDDLESPPRRTMCRNTRRFLSELVHETGFQLSHVNRDPPHTFEWHSLQVQRNKHVALLMFMELEPRGAPIGRSRGEISQSKGASISGKLLLIYLESSEIIGFSGKSISLIVSQGKNNNFISILLPHALCQYKYSSPPDTSQ